MKLFDVGVYSFPTREDDIAFFCVQGGESPKWGKFITR